MGIIHQVGYVDSTLLYLFVHECPLKPWPQRDNLLSGNPQNRVLVNSGGKANAQPCAQNNLGLRTRAVFDKESCEPEKIRRPFGLGSQQCPLVKHPSKYPIPHRHKFMPRGSSCPRPRCSSILERQKHNAWWCPVASLGPHPLQHTTCQPGLL